MKKRKRKIGLTIQWTLTKMLLKRNFVHECLPLAAGSKDIGDAQAHQWVKWQMQTSAGPRMSNPKYYLPLVLSCLSVFLILQMQMQMSASLQQKNCARKCFPIWNLLSGNVSW
jgi:hypothetical protein